MGRLTLGAMVLAGITVSGALGGQAMREGGRPRADAVAPVRVILATPDDSGVIRRHGSRLAPCPAARLDDAGCDSVAPAGD